MSAFDPSAFQAARRGTFGADLRCHGLLASTQDTARAAAEAGGRPGCVVLAEEQSAGRGRWGRSWVARPGAGLLFSVVLEMVPPEGEGGLPVLLGLATVLALRGLGLAEAGLKWPNDVWWRGRKLGGLLVERGPGALVAGCGLNVSQGESDWPDGLRGQAVSLRLAGLSVSREALLAAVLGSWERSLGIWAGRGLAAFGAEMEACDVLRGRACRLSQGRETLSGRVLGIAADGSLRLEEAGGGERRVHTAAALELRPDS